MLFINSVNVKQKDLKFTSIDLRLLHAVKPQDAVCHALHSAHWVYIQIACAHDSIIGHNARDFVYAYAAYVTCDIHYIDTDIPNPPDT